MWIADESFKRGWDTCMSKQRKFCNTCQVPKALSLLCIRLCKENKRFNCPTICNVHNKTIVLKFLPCACLASQFLELSTHKITININNNLILVLLFFEYPFGSYNFDKKNCIHSI